MSSRTGLLNRRELEKSIDKFILLSEDKTKDIFERTGITFLQRLLIDTPKRSGRAVNGWVVKVGKTSSEWKPEKNLPTYSTNSFPKGRVNFNSTFWISNNVEYIQRLDDNPGHSIQAPKGFTNDALRHTIHYTERKIAKLNRWNYV